MTSRQPGWLELEPWLEPVRWSSTMMSFSPERSPRRDCGHASTASLCCGSACIAILRSPLAVSSLAVTVWLARCCLTGDKGA